MGIEASASFEPRFRYLITPGSTPDVATADIEFVVGDDAEVVGSVDFEGLEEPAPAVAVFWDDKEAISKLPKSLRKSLKDASKQLRKQTDDYDDE